MDTVTIHNAGQFTRCGSQIATASAVFSCVRAVDENGRHIDAVDQDPLLHVDEGGFDSIVNYRFTWTDEQARQAALGANG